MINHIRTLILNRPSNYFNIVPDAPYIPAEYQPVVLTNELNQFKNVLIPTGMDPFSENFVSESIMKMLHCPELLPYTSLPDNRFTYSFGESVTTIPNPSATMIFTKSSSCDMSVVYNINPGNMPISLATSGLYQWTITPIDSVTMLVQPLRGKTYSIQVVPSGKSKKSKPIQLIQDYLTVTFTMPSSVITSSFSLNIQTVLPLSYNIADYTERLISLMARPAIRTAIFQPKGPYAATITELQEDWFASSEITLKFGCLVLDYAFQCENLRLSGGG